MTVLAALLASVSGDAPLSTSYGAPSHGDSYSPSYGGHGGHETVKRHTGGQDCNCRGVSGGSSYNGGSANVHTQPTKPNYNDIMASPQPPPYTYSQPSYSPSPQAPQPQHPAPAAQPQSAYTPPVYSPPSPPAPVAPPQPQHPIHAAQPQPAYTPPVYSAPSPPAPVASPQPQHSVPAAQPQPSYNSPVYSAPQQPAPASVTYAQPVYSPPTAVQTQPTKPNYNAIQAPTSVHSIPAQPPAPSPLYSGGGQPVYSGGRPDYNAYPPQGYAGWGLSVRPLFPQSMAFRRDNAEYVKCSVVYDRVPSFINCFLHQVFT